jgi:hypothetical protein
MKPIKSLLVLAIVCVPALAAAQGYYGGYGRPRSAVPGGFHDRTGRLTWGFAVGLGGMHDGGSTITTCVNCDFKPLAFEGDFHLGGMLTPRFGLMFEGQVNGQTIQADRFNGDTFLTQGAAMIAAQFWIIPQLWVKGGLGLASLRVDDGVFVDDFGTGGAIMGAVGVELLSARNFALELQGRVIEGTYNSLNDNITSGTIGFGINWY